MRRGIGAGLGDEGGEGFLSFYYYYDYCAIVFCFLLASVFWFSSFFFELEG